MLRKRKTKDPCPGCFLHRARCVCAAIPRLALRTRVSLIVHAKELKRTTNTGRLAVSALVNSEMIVRGEGAVDLSRLLSPEYRSVLFFPTDDAVELGDFVAGGDSRPMHLIVPDGNWRQASKVAIRHKELAGLPRVKISRPNLAAFHLRAESSPSGMSTLEAIARALEVIEGVEAAAPLLALYQAKLRGTLIGRGMGVSPQFREMAKSDSLPPYNDF
jgi:DTW domain-containing protein YfiP